MSIDLDEWAEWISGGNDALAAAQLQQWLHAVSELETKLVALETWLPEHEETRGAEIAMEASAALRSIRLVSEGLSEIEDAFQQRRRGGQR